VAEVARNHVPLVVQDLIGAGKYQEALVALERKRGLLRELHGDKADTERATLGGRVYDAWARSQVRQKEWSGAVAKYDEGLKQFPDSSLLKHNRPLVYGEWAEEYEKNKEWDKALKVYEDGRRHLPDERVLREYTARVYDLWAKTFISREDWDAAIAKYNEGLKKIPESHVLKNNKEYCEEKRKKKAGGG
jgi:tetratricopeptide (TPR) repeat protein